MIVAVDLTLQVHAEAHYLFEQISSVPRVPQCHFEHTSSDFAIVEPDSLHRTAYYTRILAHIDPVKHRVSVRILTHKKRKTAGNSGVHDAEYWNR